MMGMFSKLFDAYLGLYNKYKIAMDKISTVEELNKNVKDITKPTQSDKPSAHSSITLLEARAALASMNLFDIKKHRISMVSNTNSMEPFIDDNSVVISENINNTILIKQPIRVGDIMIYKGKRLFGRDILVIHRVIKIDKKNEKYLLRGDNNFFPDGWVYHQELVSRYFGQLQARERRQGD